MIAEKRKLFPEHILLTLCAQAGQRQHSVAEP